VALVEYSVKDVTVFIDGVEVEDIAELTITPKGEDNVTPVKDWSNRTIGWNVKDDTDAEGTIGLKAQSKTNQLLMDIVKAKRGVQVVVKSNNKEATGFSKMSIDDCHFSWPEFKPEAEEPTWSWKFIGTNFDIEY